CFLSRAFRQGYLFIEVKESEIFPDPQIFFPDEDLSNAIREGFLELQDQATERYVKKEDRLYLRRAYDAQEKVWLHYHRIKNASCQSSLQLGKLKEAVEESLLQGELLKEQAEAIVKASSETLFSIYGGPGTGKTYTAGIFLKLFFRVHQEHNLRIALVGPTGKATTNLEKSIKRACGDDFAKIEKHIEIKTLHSLLGIRRFKGNDIGRGKAESLVYHLIIVDETSMVDAALMAEFLSRIQDGTKLLFLGDPYQLPPVEPGDLFAEFVAQKSVSHELTHCMRTELVDIVELASLVKSGNSAQVREFLAQSHPSVSYQAVDPQMLESYFAQQAEKIFTQFDHNFRLLSPKKEGPWGVEAINKVLHEIAKREHQTVTPIMISKNDYQLELMNGEMGVIEKKIATFTSGTETREIPSILLSQYELAYCLSVHKSQGSEFNKVLLLLPPGSEVFGRRMLYTAITRARTSIEIWSSPETLMAILQQ
ncbi:MAG: putative exodeoxyribonuclease alpha chain recD, partial [Chlamydiia bacterium]|nr:putative exodeoxyribonuclease alpha chain recD [Chlamydiia bacterium]